MNVTAITNGTRDSTTAFIGFDTDVYEFHWCRHYLPTSVLVMSTVITILLGLSMINGMCGATCRFKRSQIKRIFYPTERKIGLLQYAVIMPMFELFVVWGSWIGISPDGSSASIVVGWITINGLCLLIMTCACYSTGNYRLMVHIAQCFRLPLAVIFFCDRIFNSVVGIESIAIGCLFLCSLFEFFHVQDYFAVLPNARPNGTGMRLHGVQAEDDSTDGPISPHTVDLMQEALAKSRAAQMGPPLSTAQHQSSIPTSSTMKNDTEMALLSHSDDEDDDNASHTELDDNLPAAVRAALNDQSISATVTDFISEVLRVDDTSDPQKVKRMVLKYKNRLTKDRSGRTSGSATGRDSEF